MGEKWEKRELYEKYAGVCLSEKEYSFLEEKNIIPKDLQKLYTGTSEASSAGNNNYGGVVVDNIASCGCKLFLENWTNTDWGEGKVGYYFFDEFIVVVAEPRINPLKQTFCEAPKVLPVAIPISNIESCESRVSGYSRFFMIRLKNGSYIRPKTFVVVDNYKPSVENIAHRVNQRLLKTYFSLSAAGVDEGQKKIEDRLNELIKNCTKDYEQRQLAIQNLFLDYGVIAELQTSIYLDELSFVKEIEKRIMMISEKEFPDIVDAIDGIKQSNMEIELERQRYIDERVNKINVSHSASFFEKIRIKKEIKKLDAKIKELNNSINDNAKYDLIYKEILKVANRGGTNISGNERFDIPDEYISLAKEVYLECESRNIKKIESEDEKMVFTLICNKKNIPEEYQTNKLFECGSMLAKKSLSDAEQQKINKSRVHKAVIHNDMKDKAYICGPIKYTKEAMEEQAKAKSMAESAELLGKLFSLQAQTKAVKSDSAIWGGIASGIAGPMAGLATYANTEADNAKAEILAAEERAKGRANLNSSRELGAGYQSVARSLGGNVARIHDKLYDPNNIDKYFSYLKCNVDSYMVEDDGMMAVNVSIEFVKKAAVNGVPIVIDGSLCINIKDGDKKIGDAYICAPGFNEMNLDKIGFNANKKYVAVGIPICGVFDKNRKYTFEIVPINIWMIEK